MLMATQSPVTVVAVATVMLVLDACVVILRFKASKMRRQHLQADDWLAFVALIFAIGLTTIQLIGVRQKALAYPTPISGLRIRTALTDSNDKIIISARLQYAFLVISVATLGTIKLSVLLFYRRLFVIETRNRRSISNVVSLTMMTIVLLWTGGFLFSFMFACKGHFSAWWTSAQSLITNCVDTLELLFAYAISDFLTDVIVIAIPLPMVLRLHLPLDRKLGVVCVFLLGALATVASMIRMIWVIWSRNVGFNTSLDEDLLITTLLFWCQLEISLGIMAACLPTLRALFQTSSVDSFHRSVRNRPVLRSSNSSATDEVRFDDFSSDEIGNGKNLHLAGRREPCHAKILEDVEADGIQVERAFKMNNELKDEGSLLSR